jgi:protein arginine N-methyltransferase 1
MFSASMTSILEFHAFLLANTGARLDRFARALAATIRPGDTVVDLGAGSGILSVLACQAGARRVYAIEDTDAVSLARTLVPTTPFRDRIEILHAKSFDITLPERADVLVGDVHSTFGLQEQGLAAMLDARDRLVKPGGRVVPASMQLCVAPAEAGDVYESKVDTWRRVVHQVNLEPARDLAVNSLHPARLTPQHLLAPPAPICQVDFARATSLHLAGRVRVAAVRAGTLHGVCGGIVTTLADRIEISNLPGDQGTSNFAHAFLPIEAPVAVSAGDDIEIQIDSYDGDELRWIVTVTAAASGATRRFTHATFLSRTLSRESLRKRDPQYRPALGVRSRMERDLLNQIDGTRTVGEIEQWLLAHGEEALTPRRLAELLAATIERCD